MGVAPHYTQGYSTLYQRLHLLTLKTLSQGFPAPALNNSTRISYLLLTIDQVFTPRSGFIDGKRNVIIYQ